ncbi:LLM class flavin-dependent oxidoreductase [Cumulibacter soli]|uniref:LLM class flavin-dependent oxidoreductase n=1 Tax=Cumulibacter soli TaxID=2546344 RepID=UPI0010686E2B|nr:LLM class flavin-dependent oxidoreductase [Cumulibacter soli]
MTDYGHELLFGTFVTPTADNPRQALDLAMAADTAGLDLVTFQDHPYQSSFLDTWTLMSYVAARTERIRIAGNVLSLPLRPPAVLARAVASLDILSGGRVNLGLGAGAFWEGIAAMGGRRLTPGQGVDALREAITVIRELWDTDKRGGVQHDGEHYQVVGAKRGPAPAHEVPIWVGAYKPKMLALTGAHADGWLPSMEYLSGGAADLPVLNARIDAAAIQAGRSPTDIRRLMNYMGASQSPSRQWAEELAALAITHGISAFIIGGDDRAITERFAGEVAPAVRELVAAERR